MKLFTKLFASLAMCLAVFGSAHALTCGNGTTYPYLRSTLSDTEFFCLDQSGNMTSSGTFVVTGGVKIGQTAPTAGSSGTGVNRGLKVPFVNAGSATLSAGAVVLASATANIGVLAPGISAAVLSTTTWVGINESSLASGATGYMSVAGYALVLTTGTVMVGDLLTSTNSVAGYAGAIAGGTSVLEGSVIGKAMSQGTAAGGLTLIRIGN